MNVFLALRTARSDLLGHKRQEITTHYSAAEVGQLIQAANRVVIRSTASIATSPRLPTPGVAVYVAGIPGPTR